MDIKFKERFIELWTEFFGDAELPLVFFYSDDSGDAEIVKKSLGHACVIGILNRVRKGKSICFSGDNIGCLGGKRYLGYSRETAPDFEYFLSYGIPGKMEGERYKKSPEIVRQIMDSLPVFKAPARYIIFKRWDAIREKENPDAVIFFTTPDVLSGLFTLASYDEVDPNCTIMPFTAGCGSIVMYPYLEGKNVRPRCVVGMLDVSARPFVPSGALTFSAPIKKFEAMVENIKESFLITSSWDKVLSRIKKAEKNKDEK
jgi:uncharacterized protein (DUF169 family)